MRKPYVQNLNTFTEWFGNSTDTNTGKRKQNQCDRVETLPWKNSDRGMFLLLSVVYVTLTDPLRIQP